MRLLALSVIAACLPLLNAQTPEQTFQRMCSGCHSSDAVTSMHQTKEGWQEIVDDMVARGAAGSPQDIQTVVNYLAAHYGKAGVAKTAGVTTKADAPAAAKRFDSKLSVPRAEQWPAYGHDAGGKRYSPLKQITPSNVAQLQRAWTFHMGKVGSEATPLVIDSVMYLTAPDAIFALEPETGKVIWKYASEGVARRGVGYSDGRIFCGVETGKMVALDAKDREADSRFWRQRTDRSAARRGG